MAFGNALMITRKPLTTARDSQRRHQQQIRGGCTGQTRQARIGNRLQLIRSKAAASTAVEGAERGEFTPTSTVCNSPDRNAGADF